MITLFNASSLNDSQDPVAFLTEIKWWQVEYFNLIQLSVFTDLNEISFGVISFETIILELFYCNFTSIFS